MLKQFFTALFPFLFAGFALAPLCAQTPLRVAAAADLEPVLPPILVQFEKNTGIHVEATYQSSATLSTQIQNGAPFDVFLSADISFPKRLIDAGLADVAAGRVKDSDAARIVERGRKLLASRSPSA